MNAMYEANLDTGLTALLAAWNALPENQPDKETALRGLKIVEMALSECGRLVSALPENLQRAIASDVKQAQWWLTQARSSVEKFSAATNEFHELKVNLVGQKELLEVGSVETVERRYWKEIPKAE